MDRRRWRGLVVKRYFFLDPDAQGDARDHFLGSTIWNPSFHLLTNK